MKTNNEAGTPDSLAQALKYEVAPAQLHARAENQLSRARAQLSGTVTNYELVANQLRAALEAVLTLGNMDAQQLSAGG